MPELDVIQRIKDLCTAYSWTYYRLAQKSGMTYSTLNSMLNKGTIPSIPTLRKICNGFGISLAQFFAEDDATATLTIAQKQHLRNWNELSCENREHAEKFIQFLLAEQEKDP